MNMLNAGSTLRLEATPDELVNQGLQAHQAGDLDRAANLYQSAIERDNQQSDALHLLGMIAFQLNQPDKAEQLILLAIKSKSDAPVFYNNLGNIYLNTDRVGQAIEVYQQAVRLKDDYVEAKFNLANAYIAQGDSGLAEIFYLRALETAPQFEPALKNLGELYVAQQKWFEALGCYENLHKLNPLDEAYSQRLSDLLTVVDADDETLVSNLRRAISLDENNIDARLTLANHFVGLENYHEASVLFENVIQLNGNCAEAYFGKAVLAKRDLNPDGAIDCFKKALEINPGYIDARFNLANTYKDLGELDLAKEAYQVVLSRNPDHVGASVNLAVILSWEGNFTDALELLKRVEAHVADNQVLQSNLGMVYHLLQNFEAAKAHYLKALAMGANPEVNWNLALTYLAEGDFEEGLRLFESRWQIPHLKAVVKRDFTRREWKGESIVGKTLLVYFEQGYGDAIQFARFIPVLLDRGARVIFQVPEVLKSLMQNLDQRAQVITDLHDAEDFDFHCSLMSLAGNLNIRLNSIPADVPYFTIAPKSLHPTLTACGEGLKVGVVWAGNPRNHDVQTNMVDKRRSCDPQFFGPLAGIANVHLFSLQYGEQPPVESGIVDLMQNVKNFEQTAEIIQQLDLVISVDTAVAHLAGALNKPVWLLSRYDSCWRWMKGRDDSPWYPSMKIYRQLEPGDWLPVFEEVKQALEDYSN